MVVREIPYARGGEERAVGDLFLPGGPLKGEPVLLIHGGGWKGLAKESFEFMLPFFLEAGRPVFNINYRLLGNAPWPACGDDCLAAGRFVLQGGLSLYGVPQAEKILICGASAGGHLAMMTGLRLPPEKVEAILSMAGPCRIDWVATNKDPLGLHEDFLTQFLGYPAALDSADVRSASPTLLGVQNPPPLFCLHSRNDLLVPLAHSTEARAVWQAAGSRAEVTVIDGHGDLHGFWIDGDRDGLLRPEVGQFVHETLGKLL